MKILSNNDLRFVASRVPRDVRRWISLHELSIGGGFIREVIAGGEVKDIDIFGSNKANMRAALFELKRCAKQMGRNAVST